MVRAIIGDGQRAVGVIGRVVVGVEEIREENAVVAAEIRESSVDGRGRTGAADVILDRFTASEEVDISERRRTRS